MGSYQRQHLRSTASIEPHIREWKTYKKERAGKCLKRERNGYLKENRWTKTYACLLGECQHLREYYQLLKSDTELEIGPSPLGVSLITILEEWGRLRQQDTILSTSGPNTTDAGKQREDRMSPHSSTCNTRDKKSNIHKRRSSYSPRARRVKALDSFDDTAESVVDSEDGEDYRNSNLRPCMHGDALSTEEDSDCQGHRLRRSRLRKSKSPWEYHGTTQVSRHQKRRVSPRHRHYCPQSFHRRSRHEQFHDCGCHMTLLQTDNHGKSGGKYPNLLNLLQVSSMCKDSGQQKSGKSNSTVQHEKSLTVSLPDPLTSDGRNCPETQITPTSSHNTSGSVTAAGSISSTVVGIESNTGRKSGKSPSNRSQSLITKTPSKSRSSEDLNSSTKSPRRKKPKTPRKRNSVSPTNSVKELSGSEDKLPLFKQVLSDRRLHEKLAETCNIVTGQLKLSVNGSSGSGDKPKVISPPQNKAKDGTKPVSASKSLEEILDLDTNYASEFLSENIDMSDPAFDCLFKLFGTDKESFSENIRKENQNAVKETEKLQQDLEELERSINEEFGPRSNRLTEINDKQEGGASPALPQSTDDPADPVCAIPTQENRITAFSSSGSQDMSHSQNQMIVNQSGVHASPHVSQAVCQSPFLAGDGVSHCIADGGMGHFTALLRDELGSSPAHSTPSRKSAYSNNHYIASPASVTTQPFSPYQCSSPASYLSPRSNVTMEIPGTPVATETQVAGQETLSQRSDQGDVTIQKNHHRSSQEVLDNHSLPSTTDFASGSPMLPHNNGQYTPQQTKRVFHPVKSTQLFLSPQLPPLKTSNSISDDAQYKANDTPLQDEGISSKDSCHVEKTLTDTNFDPANGETGTNESNSAMLETGTATILDTGSNQYQENPVLNTVVYGENGTSSNMEPSTIVNTIGCISLPKPDAYQGQTISDETEPKKKRATRSDKGKRRKKESGTDHLLVLKGLLSQQSKSATEEGVMESESLRQEDFENQQLVVLSPGGSSMIKIPILDCIDEISSPSRALDGKAIAASETETEGSNCVSLTLENQVTAALVDSIKSGNTNDIIKNAKDMAEDTNDDKKKGCVKKLRRTCISKVDKTRDQRKAHAVPEEPSVAQEDIYTATPLQYKMRNVHVRMLDFGKQFKHILPKPSPPKSSDNPVISHDRFVCNRNFVLPSLFGSTKTESNAAVTSSLSSNEEGSLSMSAKDLLSPFKLHSLTSSNIKIATQISSPPCNVSTSTSGSIVAKTPKKGIPDSDLGNNHTNCDSSCSNKVQGTLASDKSNENKSEHVYVAGHGESDMVAKDSHGVTVKRHTRSCKPATLERLNDKGVAEKIASSDENSKKEESSISERMIYRRKPKGGKDMRVIIKHLRAFEEEDDVFSDFSENASPQSKASDSDNMQTFEAKRKCSKKVQRLEVELNRNKTIDTDLQCKGLGKENLCHKYKSKEKSPLKESGTKDDTSKGSSDKRKGKSPPKKKVAFNPRCRKSLVGKEGSDGSSSEDLPLISFKNRHVESSQDARASESKFKCTESHSMNKTKTVVNEDDNLRNVKLKDKDKKTKANGEKLEIEKTQQKTPIKSQVSPERSVQLDETTPSKESWMEHVGLTPTKDLINAHNYTSPGRPNPLDVIAVCQNSTSSDKTLSCTRSLRSMNESPFKTPSKATHKNAAKRLFEKNSPTVMDKECTLNKVERIIKRLQVNNPDSNLVTKVRSSRTTEDGKIKEKVAVSSKARKEENMGKKDICETDKAKKSKSEDISETDKGKNSKSKDVCEKDNSKKSKSKHISEIDKGKSSKKENICERNKSPKKKEKPKVIKEKVRDLSSKKENKKKHDSVVSTSEKRTVKGKNRDIVIDENGNKENNSQKKICDPNNSSQVIDKEEHIVTGEVLNDSPTELENDVNELNTATDFLMKEMEGLGDTLGNNEIQIDITVFEAQEDVSEPVLESGTEADEGKGTSVNDSSQYGSENRTAINSEDMETFNNTKERRATKNFGQADRDKSDTEAEKSKKSQNSRKNVNDESSLNERGNLNGENGDSQTEDGVNDNCSVNHNVHEVNDTCSIDDHEGGVHGNDVEDRLKDKCSVNEKDDKIQKNIDNIDEDIEVGKQFDDRREKVHSYERIAERDIERYEDNNLGLNEQNYNTNASKNNDSTRTVQDSQGNNTESVERSRHHVTMEMGVAGVREGTLGDNEHSEIQSSITEEGAVHRQSKHKKKKSKKRKREELHEGDGEERRKKKSKKRKREESLEGDSEERHKKKRKKHDKHKENHHKKHRKSSDLSSLNIDAALSQLYTRSETTADNPYRTPHTAGRLSSPVGQHATEQVDATRQTVPRINSDLLRVSEHEHPLKHSTPILNNNFDKEGAFGNLFSPVMENS